VAGAEQAAPRPLAGVQAGAPGAAALAEHVPPGAAATAAVAPEQPAAAPAAATGAPASGAASAEQPASKSPSPAASPVPAAATSIPQHVAGQAAATAAPPAPETPAPRLPVHPDHARALLHIANHRGQAHARLTLHPAELGGVEVRLRATTHGLLASITAETPESAQVLQQAGADLKRALEAQGVTLAGLDFGVAGDEARQRAHQRDADTAAARTAGRADHDDDLLPIDPDHPTTTAPTIALGALVDVLA
jgi:flagellar hook-length control protein FliK